MRDPRSCHTPAVPSGHGSGAPAVAVTELGLGVQGRAPSRSSSRTSTGSPSRRRRRRRKGTLVHRALELLMLPRRRPTARSTRRWSTSRPPGSSWPTTPSSPSLELDATRSGRSSTPTPRSSCGATSSSRTRARSAPSASSSSSAPSSAGVTLRGHHRPARARRRRRVRRHRLQDRVGARASSHENARLAGVHIYAVLCEQMLGRRPARVQLYYLSKPEAIIATPTEQSVAGVERKDRARVDGDRCGPASATTSGPIPVRCATTARSSRTAPPSAAIPCKRPSCAAPAR